MILKRKTYKWTLNHQRTKWNEVIFSDELTFQLFINTCFIISKKNKPAPSIPNFIHRYKVNLWAIISISNLIGVHLFEKKIIVRCNCTYTYFIIIHSKISIFPIFNNIGNFNNYYNLCYNVWWLFFIWINHHTVKFYLRLFNLMNFLPYNVIFNKKCRKFKLSKNYQKITK